MELTYTKVGDYYIPNLTLDDGAECEIGVYGRMREHFLKEHHPGTYNRLILSGKLWKHLAEIDAACNERMDTRVSAMAKQEGVTEVLKASNQTEWVDFYILIQSLMYEQFQNRPFATKSAAPPVVYSGL